MPVRDRGDNRPCEVTTIASSHIAGLPRLPRRAGSCTGGCLQGWLQRRTRRGTGGVTGSGTPPEPERARSGRSEALGKPDLENDTSMSTHSRGERSPSWPGRRGLRPSPTAPARLAPQLALQPAFQLAPQVALQLASRPARRERRRCCDLVVKGSSCRLRHADYFCTTPFRVDGDGRTSCATPCAISAVPSDRSAAVPAPPPPGWRPAPVPAASVAVAVAVAGLRPGARVRAAASGRVSVSRARLADDAAPDPCPGAADLTGRAATGLRPRAQSPEQLAGLVG